MSRIAEATVLEDSASTQLARIVGMDNVPITQGNVDYIQFKVFDLYDQDNTTPITEANLVTENVIFDDLQTDRIWTLDTLGYNFKHTIDFATLNTTGRLRLRVEYRIFPTGGTSRYSIAYELSLKELLSH